MDAFFASVEQRDHPELRGQPVIVGSPPTQRGVVCAASYEARKFGVHSAMPSATAGRLCPRGAFVRPRIDHYRAESDKIMEMVSETGALIEQVSIDEAYLDLTEKILGATAPPPPADEALVRAMPIAKELKGRISSERGLTASIGIATNKFLAKLGSDYQKPNGLTLIPEKDKSHFCGLYPCVLSMAWAKSPKKFCAKPDYTPSAICRISPVICAPLSGHGGQR
jgi:DNA polymerase-4